MAFNPKYSSIPMISDNIGMPDLPIVFPYRTQIKQWFMGDKIQSRDTTYKSGQTQVQLYVPAASQVQFYLMPGMTRIGYSDSLFAWSYVSLPFFVEPQVYPMDDWCRVSAYDSTRYNNSSYPLVVYFKANTRKIEQQNVVVKYDDEVGTIIPLSQKQFNVLTFTTQPMNSDYARLLLDIAEWDNVTFQYWDTKTNAWSTAINVAKKAESWQKTTYPKTLGTTIQGSFVIKQ